MSPFVTTDAHLKNALNHYTTFAYNLFKDNVSSYYSVTWAVCFIFPLTIWYS